MNLKFGILLMSAIFLLTTIVVADVAVVLELDYNGDGNIDEMSNTSMAEESSALDLLNETTEVDFKWSEWGAMVDGINGVLTNYYAEGTWWSFNVNGVQAGVTTDEYLLQDEDIITLTQEGTTEQDITVILEVDYEGDELIDKAVHQVMPENSTALDLLTRATELNTTQNDWGVLVVEIDGIETDFALNGTWWAFCINGNQSSVTTENYVLQNGDIITMSLSKA